MINPLNKRKDVAFDSFGCAEADMDAVVGKLNEVISAVNELVANPLRVVENSWANEPLKTIDCTGQPTKQARLEQLEKVLATHAHWICATGDRRKKEIISVKNEIYQHQLEKLKELL